MERFTVVSGCSGGGKSTLIAQWKQRGLATVAEPGRRIVVEEEARGGRALPWIDMSAFAKRAVEMARQDYEEACAVSGRVLFDRGLVDAVAALHHHGGHAPEATALLRTHRYGTLVFLTPPWPEIYVGDAERRHGFQEAIAEYERLAAFYPTLGYEVAVLPKASIEQRIDFMLERLSTL